MQGKQVPDVSLHEFCSNSGGVCKVSSKAVFGTGKVIVFALPGAYTPTCSKQHVPGYDNLFTAFQSLGVDKIVCLSVNDAFVMKNWADKLGAKHVQFYSDGNGDFAKAVGMLKDFSASGFGMRSWRYSMLVESGTITKFFPEPSKEGDPFEVSDAETMIKAIDPEYQRPPRVTMLTLEGCPHCKKATEALEAAGLGDQLQKIFIEKIGAVTIDSVFAITGQKTVPQVFVDGKHIGGCEKTLDWLQQYSRQTDRPGMKSIQPEIAM